MASSQTTVERNPARVRAETDRVETSLPAASLIICTRNRPQLLLDLVHSVLEGNEQPAEMIIVDDSDAPNLGIQELSASYGSLRYLWTHARGLSRANNDGIAAARYEILVFTQDDVLVTPTWFGTLVRSLVDAGPRVVVTGRTPPEAADGGSRFAPSTVDEANPSLYEGKVGEGVLYVQNMAMYRDLYERIGSFDERIGPGTPFPSAEDNDFAYRVLKAGFRIAYVPDATVYHRAWRTDEAFVPLRWNYGLGRGAVYAKHIALRDKFMLRQMARDIRVHVVGGIVHFRSERTRAIGELVLAAGIVYGAIRWILK